MIYDFHCHSTCSDGALSPAQLVSRAAERGVDMLALTDHDSIRGLDEARAAAGDRLQLVNGVEISARWQDPPGAHGVQVHVVGLGFDAGNALLQEQLAGQRDVRVRRAEMIARAFAERGIEGLLPEARERAGSGSIGRPHFVQALLARGLVKDEEEAYRRYLRDGGCCDVPVPWPEMADAVHWIVSAGGVAVLAHPALYELGRRRMARLLDDFQTSGGMAIEVSVGGASQGDVDRFAGLARQRGLLASCGSDFHTPRQHWRELGRYPRMPADLKPVWQHESVFSDTSR